MDGRCSTIAFVTLPAVVSLHLKLCELACSKVTKCQTQLETYPTGTSSVALHLKFESTRRAAKVDVRPVSIDIVIIVIDGCPNDSKTQSSSPGTIQDIFVLYREPKAATEFGIDRKLSIFNFDSFGCDHLVESAARTHPRYPVTSVAWHDLACHDSVAMF